MRCCVWYEICIFTGYFNSFVTLRFSDIFSGKRKDALGTNGIIMVDLEEINSKKLCGETYYLEEAPRGYIFI